MTRRRKPIPAQRVELEPNPTLDLIETNLNPLNLGNFAEAIRVFSPFHPVDFAAKLAEMESSTEQTKRRVWVEILEIQEKAGGVEAGANHTLHLIFGLLAHSSWLLGLIARFDREFKQFDQEQPANFAPLLCLAITIGENLKVRDVLESRLFKLSAQNQKRGDAARKSKEIPQSEVHFWSQRYIAFKANYKVVDRKGNPKMRGCLSAFYQANEPDMTEAKIRSRLELAGHVSPRKSRA